MSALEVTLDFNNMTATIKRYSAYWVLDYVGK